MAEMSSVFLLVEENTHKLGLTPLALYFDLHKRKLSISLKAVNV
jgi:hypothetical protein